ncbi:MAG TPA: hypothetical protein VJ719_01055 [Chthoniobacterales bacterium]|nr:hypothetical protein [Chthoniobacterales bacterium]
MAAALGDAVAAAAGDVPGLAFNVAVTVDPGAGEPPAIGAPGAVPGTPGAPGAAVGIPGGGGTFVAGAPGAPGAAGWAPVAGLTGAPALGGGGGGGGFCAEGGDEVCAKDVSATSVRLSVSSVFIFAAEVE